MDNRFKDLIDKWSEVLDEGIKIKNPKVRQSTAVMLENQHKWLVEGAGISYGGDNLNTDAGYATSGMFHKIAVPMVRRTFPELLAHEIVGVQPLTGPVGLAFALRFASPDDTTYAGTSGGEIGYNTIDNAYSGTGTTPSGTGFDVEDGEALGSLAGSGVGSDIGLGIGTGTHIREVGMTIEKAQVEAKTRKLRSRWSLEVAQDIKAMHGLNLEEEMMDVLAYEITAEIDRELIQEITEVAVTSTIDYDSSTDVDGRWEAERFRALYHYAIRKANQIAINTRRGAGNFIIASPIVCAAFESIAAFTVAPVPEDINTAVTGVARIGSLDGRMNVYRDTFYTNTTYQQFIVGYKGPSEYDTGIIYLPYIQLLAGKATFEDSFNPAIGLMSRYAIHSHIFGASNYYQKVRISDMPN